MEDYLQLIQNISSLHIVVELKYKFGKIMVNFIDNLW